MPAILFVEDAKHQRMLLKEEFTHEGYTALTAPNSDAALATVERAMPDLVVVDIAMPGMDGLELLGKLLAMNNRLPVIIHSAYTSYKDNFMSWAADAYVVKQSNLAELKQTVRSVLGERQFPGKAGAAAPTA